jgi:DNA-binding PadR family transcriptional regulator
MARPARTEPSLTEWAVLGLLCEGPTHGWTLVRSLGADGEIGRVWTTSHPLVYRAISVLREKGYLEERGSEASSVGPARTLLAATPTGRRAFRRWLARPVEHVRDVRSELMLKLLFLQRRSEDPRPLLQAQRAVLEPTVRALAANARRADGFDRTLALWRLSNARATLRFLDAIASAAR